MCYFDMKIVIGSYMSQSIEENNAINTARGRHKAPRPLRYTCTQRFTYG
jgi:hypothetical protein